MEKKENYTYGVAYKLYAIENGVKTMLEEAPASQPFRFISGLSMALPSFENKYLLDFSNCNDADSKTFPEFLAKAYRDKSNQRYTDSPDI